MPTPTPSPEALRAAKRFRAEVIGLTDATTTKLALLIDAEFKGRKERTVFSELEDKLSPLAKHALESYQIFFQHGDQELSVHQLRTAIRWIYGVAVDDELKQHLADRRDAVIPKSPAADSPTGRGE